MAVIVPRSFRLLDEFPGHWGMGKAGKSQFAPSSSHPYAQTWWKSKITPALFPENIFNGYPDTGPPPATWPPATWPASQCSSSKVGKGPKGRSLWWRAWSLRFFIFFFHGTMVENLKASQKKMDPHGTAYGTANLALFDQ